MSDHSEALFDVGRLRPVGPVESSGPKRFDATTETGIRRVAGLPLGLAVAKVVDAAEISQLVKGKLRFVAQGAGNDLGAALLGVQNPFQASFGASGRVTLKRRYVITLPLRVAVASSLSSP